MTSTIDSPPAAPVPPTPQQHRHSAGHIAAIVIGCLLLLPGIGLTFGGGALAVAQAVATDDDGYFRFTLDRLDSDGVAVGTTDLWFDDADGEAPWVFDLLDVDFRFRVEGAGPTDDVFVGVARAADVERYLADAAWSELIEIDERSPRYRQLDGETSVEPPLEQDFWTASASGPGEQELVWDARGGRWSIVVMNVDGSAGVEADIEIGVRSGAVTPIAVTMLVVGVVLIAGAIVLIVVGGRGRRTPDSPPTAHQPLAAPQPPAPAASAPDLPAPEWPTAAPDSPADADRDPSDA